VVSSQAEFYFSLGGLGIRLQFDGVDAEPYRSFLEDLAPFEAPEGDAELLFHIRPVARAPGLKVDEKLAGELWARFHRFPFDDRPEDRLRVQLKFVRDFLGDPGVGQVLEHGAEWDCEKVLVSLATPGPSLYFFEEGRVEVFRHERRDRQAGHHLMSLFFQVLSAALCTKDGLLVHATGIGLEGRGYAFLGLSGAGKSTVGKLSPGALLADDGLIMRKVDGAFRLFPTPFCQQKTGGRWQKGVELGSALLRKILFLEQAADHGLEPVPAPEAALKFLQHYIHYFQLFPDTLARAAFETVARLVGEHPVKTLRFRKDKAFWDLLI
jgi:hypothetical protein